MHWIGKELGERLLEGGGDGGGGEQVGEAHVREDLQLDPPEVESERQGGEAQQGGGEVEAELAGAFVKARSGGIRQRD